MGLPIHLFNERMYRVIGDQCGNFVEVDELLVDVGVVRLRVEKGGRILSRVLVHWETLTFSIPIWPAEGSMMEVVLPLSRTRGGLRREKEGRDWMCDRRDWRRFGSRLDF